MGKSSSSSKKIKHSRDSSKLRSVKKKKTKRSKSKKIRRLKDDSDENDSSGSDSSLYFSSEDDYRRKKLRSKVSKKRSRKRYSSTESDDSDDNDARLLKKKKRSKRKQELVGKKKKKKKKKIGSRKRRKRDSTSSSTSSESEGSIRDNQSNDGSESDAKRKTKRLGKVKAMQRRSKDESEEDYEPDESWQVEDEVMREKNSRRLKSIVVVSYTFGNDERKEDMVHDYDDESDGKKNLDDERYREATISYHRTGADENGRKTVGYNEFEEDIKSETSKSSRPDNSLKDDDLEAILKKRALENLKRFRGETQKSGVASKEVSSVSEGETLQTESEKAQESQDHGLMEQRSWNGAAGSKDLEAVQNVKESETVLADTAKVKVSSGISSCTPKRKLIRPVLAHRKEADGCQDPEAESINGSTIDKNSPECSLALPTKNGGENIESTKVSSSHADTETLDEIKGRSQSEEKKMDETKDESQYEQKTMTVMRGGEMVQVSYKVYIPKKTSSLGRKQLKR